MVELLNYDNEVNTILFSQVVIGTKPGQICL